jgi:hypothetical protein
LFGADALHARGARAGGRLKPTPTLLVPSSDISYTDVQHQVMVATAEEWYQ